jgi:hypothetical protein
MLPFFLFPETQSILNGYLHHFKPQDRFGYKQLVSLHLQMLPDVAMNHAFRFGQGLPQRRPGTFIGCGDYIFCLLMPLVSKQWLTQFILASLPPSTTSNSIVTPSLSIFDFSDYLFRRHLFFLLSSCSGLLLLFVLVLLSVLFNYFDTKLITITIILISKLANTFQILPSWQESTRKYPSTLRPL